LGALVLGFLSGIALKGLLEGIRIPPTEFESVFTLKMLNKLTVTELAEFSKMSKGYISQVKGGLRPPSEKLLEAIRHHCCKPQGDNGRLARKYIDMFLNSRRDGTSSGTIDFYRCYLSKAIPALDLKTTANRITNFLNCLSCSPGGKHAYYRAISVFYNWLYSPKSGFGGEIDSNPILLVEPPKQPKRIMPSLTRKQVDLIIETAHCVRDRAIIALFSESGLRLSELANIKLKDIDWDTRTITVIGKGNKEGYAPFGDISKHHLSKWLAEYKSEPDQPIWNIGFWGIKAMLEELKVETGLPCNPHTFRRTFACLLRKAGVDCMTIKDLGRWESLEMVQRYTRSITFQDSLKFYKAPLS
jgi:integrase